MRIKPHTKFNHIVEWVIAHEDIADTVFVFVVLPGVIVVAALCFYLSNGNVPADVHFAMMVGSASLALGLGSMLLSQVFRETREGRINVGSRSTHYIYRRQSPTAFKVAAAFKTSLGLFVAALGLVGLVIYVLECHKQGRFPSLPTLTHVRSATLD